MHSHTSYTPAVLGLNALSCVFLCAVFKIFLFSTCSCCNWNFVCIPVMKSPEFDHFNFCLLKNTFNCFCVVASTIKVSFITQTGLGVFTCAENPFTLMLPKEHCGHFTKSVALCSLQFMWIAIPPLGSLFAMLTSMFFFALISIFIILLLL